MSSNASTIRPNSWLRELTKLKPATWRWGRSIRAAIGIGLPLSVGIAIGQIPASLWIAMGSLFQAGAERDGPYKALYWKLAISAPMGAAGCFLGYLSGLPWVIITLTMTGIAFLAAILSSYNSGLSVGCLQALVMGAVMLGNPQIGAFWQPALLMLAGTLLYATLLGIEILLYRQRPHQELMTGLMAALRDLASARASGEPGDSQRQMVTDKLAALYALLLQTRYHALGRMPLTERTAAALQRFDALFAAILACDDAGALRTAAEQLTDMSLAMAHNSKFAAAAAMPSESGLQRAVGTLATTIWGATPALSPAPAATSAQDTQPLPTQPKRPHQRLHILLDRLQPGRSTVMSALALALCTGIGYSLHLIDSKSHWYWVPMTIFIVMKPDLGSIFARTVLRCLGTSAGVALGAVVLALLSPGPAFVLIMALIAGLMPWAAQRSYALFALTLTPLVLVLIDFVSPETKGVNYAVLRLVDTLLGGAIVLVFGYLIWPRTHGRELTTAFHRARQSIATYLRAVLPNADPSASQMQQASTCRRNAYGSLAEIRTQLQNNLAEPPPAGREAAAWFPLITSAERLCDAITSYSASASATPDPAKIRELATLADLISTAGHNDVRGLAWHGKPDDSAESRLIERIIGELAHVHALSEAEHG